MALSIGGDISKIGQFSGGFWAWDDQERGGAREQSFDWTARRWVPLPSQSTEALERISPISTCWLLVTEFWHYFYEPLVPGDAPRLLLEAQCVARQWMSSAESEL